jgi:hypothetical protein
MSKKYLTSEAIAMLEKNPKLRFKNQENYGLSVNEDNGCLILKHYSNIISDNNNIRIADCNKFKADEWELIQQPVPVLEAIAAYYHGTTIRCEINGFIHVYQKLSGSDVRMKDTTGDTIGAGEILYGTWYVEDSNE